MRVLGVTKGETSLGKRLRSGGSALIIDGRLVCAVAEERVTGLKQAPGYTASMERVLEAAGLSLGDVDRIAVSTCCEPEQEAANGHLLAGDPRVTTVNHHLSHAALAFYTSGFDRALVVVADGGGNVLEPRTTTRWWQQRREQNSYFFGIRDVGLKLIEHDFSDPEEVGFGEMFRAFTYFLGWPSSRYSSRLMALAAHGRPDAFKADIYELHDGHLTCPLANDPPRPQEMVLSLGDLIGADFGEPRAPRSAILPVHRDIASFVQGRLELALIRKLRTLRRQIRFDKVCLAGGVALNVLANGRLLKEGIVDDVYVPPAPADDGQCVGNALVAAMSGREAPRVLPIRTSSQAALGPAPTVNSAAVSDALHRAGASSFVVLENSDPASTIASFLAGGAAVILYQGRSEFGPRALGQRSILGDPRTPETRSLFNELKRRESFMPFAPAVLRERVPEWFETDAASPFMSFAIPVKAEFRDLVPAVVSQNGTARLQTVAADDDPLLRRVLVEFERMTGVPMVLNTSFNRGGRPIVETVDDAIRTFMGLAINVMALGRFLVVKSLSPDFGNLDILPTVYDIDVVVVRGAERMALSSPRSTTRHIRRVQALTGSVVFVRYDFNLYGPYLEWLRAGRKVTTIRFRKGGVEVPKQSLLPLYVTKDYSYNRSEKPVETVRIQSIRYQRFGELTEADAHRDGFDSLASMLADFKQIYPTLSDHDWVTIYGISLLD